MGDEIGVRRDIAEHRAVSPTSRDQRSPPGTGINWPVLQRASAEATNATTGATSLGRPSRGGGRFAARGECRRSSPICLHRVVWIWQRCPVSLRLSSQLVPNQAHFRFSHFAAPNAPDVAERVTFTSASRRKECEASRLSIRLDVIRAFSPLSATSAEFLSRRRGVAKVKNYRPWLMIHRRSGELAISHH